MTETNVRKAHCGQCKRLLQKGEGVRYRYAMFHGNGEFYYLCPGCDKKYREEKEKKEKEKAV